MLRIRRLASVALVGLTLLLTACSSATPPVPAGTGQQPGSQPSASQPGTPKRGGTFTLSAGIASFAGTDPAMGQMSYQVWPVIGEYLIRRDPDTWQLLPSLIEKWEFSPDGTSLTLNVRKGVKFSNKPPVNGREVEAKDVVYTLKALTGALYPQLPTVRFPRRSQFEAMKDAEAVDKYTVKLTLTGPSATFLDGLTEYRAAVVLPEGIREHFGGPDSLATPDVERYIAPGPFIMTKFVNQIEVEYDRNPDYWDVAPDGKPKPYLDHVRYVWIADRGTENAAFVASQIDVTAFISNQDREFVTSQRKDANIVTYTPTSCWHRFAFNMQRKPFDDVRVRKAISLILDRPQAGNQFFGDWEGKPLWRLPGPLPWVFPEAIPQEELAKLPGYRLPKDQDIAEAKRLLKEAGYENGFDFEILTTTTVSGDYAQLFHFQLQQAMPGAKITLKRVDNAINQQLAAKSEFDTQYYCYIHEATGVAMMKTAYHSKGGRNYGQFSDAKMDALLDQAEREIDAEKRKQILREAQMLALDLMPYAPSIHYASQVALQPHVRDARYGAGSDRQVWFKNVWLDK